MSLANLLPPMTKSWADEANDEFEEQCIDAPPTRHFVDTSKFDSETAIGEGSDFRDYETIDFSDDEDTMDSYDYALKFETLSNDDIAAVVTVPEETISPKNRKLGTNMTSRIPRAVPYSAQYSYTNAFLDIIPEIEESKDQAQDSNQTTAVTELTLDNWQGDFPVVVDDCDLGIGSVQGAPELGGFDIWDSDSCYSSHSELEEVEEEIQIDHPLMGKDVVRIQVSFTTVKASEYEAHPTRVFYRSSEPTTWGWTPSNLRHCQTVIREEGSRCYI
ncbi:hypothetical protein BELL_0177g00070 [Botrytis elliptica]|uniref:Uncharacterized protein n=1 Tax=Botrytis elliptica TaxID=278938 RepID=A0A4Z1JWK9_9HELO|nr:hypothetical protein EAE99_005241 [Botrytis elliptica]TGO76050.1 hypothetical protein BELL_0177g00070 [Botrytis elliptica]